VVGVRLLRKGFVEEGKGPREGQKKGCCAERVAKNWGKTCSSRRNYAKMSGRKTLARKERRDQTGTAKGIKFFPEKALDGRDEERT